MSSLLTSIQELARKYEFEIYCTSSACPEQYDVIWRGLQVGYLRLRHGIFKVEYPTVDGVTLFEDTIEDGDGMFESDEQRYLYLGAAFEVITTKLNETSVE